MQPMNGKSAAPGTRLPDWPFVMYLITGLGGLIFMVGEEAARLGWLEKAVNFIFGNAAKSILENIYGIKILLPFLLVPAFPLILFLAVFIVFRYWRWWQLAGPSAVLLLLISIFFGGGMLMGYQDEVLGTTLLILSGLYFLSASFVGLRWLIKTKRSGF